MIENHMNPYGFWSLQVVQEFYRHQYPSKSVGVRVIDKHTILVSNGRFPLSTSSYRRAYTLPLFTSLHRRAWTRFRCLHSRIVELGLTSVVYILASSCLDPLPFFTSSDRRAWTHLRFATYHRITHSRRTTDHRTHTHTCTHTCRHTRTR